MRDILCRGKRLDNGAWETGFLVILRLWCHDAKYYIADKMTGYHEPVDMETIGQYTGLTDKNKRMIFEGDVVRTKKYGKVVCHKNVNDFDTFVVTYSPCTFRLERKNPERGFNLVGNGSDYEVIGNIHDNADLINDMRCDNSSFGSTGV